MSATNVAFVPLANSKCNTCGHLVGHAKVFHDNCHFTKGNSNCPAKVFQIGVGVNVEKASQAIAEALHACDVDALQKHVNRLAGFKKVQSREVLSLVFNKTALLYGIEISDSDEEDEDGDGAEQEQEADDAQDASDSQEGQDSEDADDAEDEADGDDAGAADVDADADTSDADAEALTALADDSSDDAAGEAAEGADTAADADAEPDADGSDDEDEWHAE